MKISKFLAIITLGLTVPQYAETAGCGDSAVIATVLSIVKKTYFEKARELSLVLISAIERDADLDTWGCRGTLEFERTPGDSIYRIGPVYDPVMVSFYIRPNATEPDNEIISVNRIPQLELDL